MDTQGYAGRLDHGQDRAGTRASSQAGRLALMSLLAGAAVGAGFGWSVNEATTPIPSSDVPLAAVASPVIEVSTPSQAGLPTAGRRSLVVSIPEERAYVKSSSIAIAGMAFSRPHAPRIQSVRAELYVAGKLVERADLDVFSSRFAGVLQLSTPIGPAAAELRISDTTRPARPIVVRHLTIDASG